MKYQFIILKKNASLKMLAELTGMKEDEMVEQILHRAIICGCLIDAVCATGETLMKHFEESEPNISPSKAASYCLDTSTPTIDTLFKGLVVWGKPCDCPECGCLLWIEEEKGKPLNGYDNSLPDEYEIISRSYECTNQDCSYKERKINGSTKN